MSNDSSSDLDKRQTSTLPRMPSPYELPGGVLSAQSSSTKVFSMASNSIPMQTSRRSSMNSHISSRSFDIDPNVDLIKPTSSDDTIDINVEIQRILGEDSDKSTSSHVESSAGGTNSSSLGCTEDTQDVGEETVDVTDSTKISPAHYKQPLSPQEDTGSLALIAAAAAAAISAPNKSTDMPCTAANDEQRQRIDLRGVSHSMVGDRNEPYESKAHDDASGDPYSVMHHQHSHSFSGGGVYLEYSALPNTNTLVAGMTVNGAQGYSECIPASHSFDMTIHPSSVVAPTGVACAPNTWSRNGHIPPVDEVGNIEEFPETKKWRRRRPKKKKASSPKRQKSPFERRPVKGPGSRGKRGSYKCRLCGQAKAKHICSAVEPYDASSQEDAQVQTATRYADEKIALSSGIRVIAVRERRVIVADMPGGKEEELHVDEEAGEVILNVGSCNGSGNGEANEDAIPFAAV